MAKVHASGPAYGARILHAIHHMHLLSAEKVTQYALLTNHAMQEEPPMREYLVNKYDANAEVGRSGRRRMLLMFARSLTPRPALDQKHWDKFYMRNTTNFYKDRHWLTREFPELLVLGEDGDAAAAAAASSPPSSSSSSSVSGEGKEDKEKGPDVDQAGPADAAEGREPAPQPNQRVLLEAGAGVGNTVFPLMDVMPRPFFYACDFSHRAVKLMQANEHYASGRVRAFHCDLTKDALVDTVPAASVDIVTLFFVLAAITPSKMLGALKSIFEVWGRLRVRGCVWGNA